MSYFAKVPFIVYQGSYFLYERFYLLRAYCCILLTILFFVFQNNVLSGMKLNRTGRLQELVHWK